MSAGRDPGEAALRQRRLRARNLAMMAALLAFVAIVYVVSIVKMGGGQ